MHCLRISLQHTSTLVTCSSGLKPHTTHAARTTEHTHANTARAFASSQQLTVQNKHLMRAERAENASAAAGIMGKAQSSDACEP